MDVISAAPHAVALRLVPLCCVVVIEVDRHLKMPEQDSITDVMDMSKL